MNNITEKRGNKTILRVHDDIVDMKSGEAFKAALAELFDRGEKNVVLDFNGIRRINSHGIGKILMFYKRFQGSGGNLYVAPLSGAVKETFETLMLDKLLKECKI